MIVAQNVISIYPTPGYFRYLYSRVVALGAQGLSADFETFETSPKPVGLSPAQVLSWANSARLVLSGTASVTSCVRVTTNLIHLARTRSDKI